MKRENQKLDGDEGEKEKMNMNESFSFKFFGEAFSIRFLFYSDFLRLWLINQEGRLGKEGREKARTYSIKH